MTDNRSAIAPPYSLYQNQKQKIMKYFIKQHKALTFFIILSITFVILSLIHQTKGSKSSPIDILVVQIAIGFLINFIFYVTMSFIPEKRKLEYSRKIIARRLNYLIGQMKAFPDAIIKQFAPDESENRVTRLTKASNHLDSLQVLDSAGVCLTNTGTYTKWTVGNFLYTKTMRVEEEIDRILRYYSYAVTPELDELFDRILHTGIHTSLKMHHEHNSPFVNESDDFLIYDKLADELEKIKESYS